METVLECPECSGTEFTHDIVDLMGDGVEEHFGKTAVICLECNLVVDYV